MAQKHTFSILQSQLNVSVISYIRHWWTIVFRKNRFVSDVLAVAVCSVCKAIQGKGRSYITGGRDYFVIWKEMKKCPQLDWIKMIKYDNIIHSRPVGNGSWEQLRLINTCVIQKTLVTSFWQEAFLSKLKCIQGTAESTAWKIKLMLIMNTEYWMNNKCWKVLKPNPV